MKTDKKSARIDKRCLRRSEGRVHRTMCGLMAQAGGAAGATMDAVALRVLTDGQAIVCGDRVYSQAEYTKA